MVLGGVKDKLKDLFSDPTSFFKGIDRERGIANSIIWLLIVIIIHIIIKAAILLTMMQGFPEDAFFTALILYGVNILGIFFAFFLAALILHAFAKMFHGKADISTTFKILAYSSTPYWLLSWLPYIGLFTIFLCVFLAIFGVMQLHKISGFKASLAFIIPFGGLYIIASYVIYTIALNLIV